MNNNKEKDCYKKKKAGKEYENNVTESIVCNKLFTAKTSNQKHDKGIFIADSGATSHMVKSENYITKLKDTKTRVTI